MKTATLVTDKLSGFTGHAALYRLSTPAPYGYGKDAKTTEYVVVSATRAFGAVETYIFPSNSDGELISWGEMEGSMKYTLSHEEALTSAGYEVAK